MDNRITSFRGEYRFLSNFWKAKTVYQGIEFPTSEHAYQAAKSDDERMWRYFATLETPGEAKRCGKMINPPCSYWVEFRTDIMLALLKSKFSDEHLMDKLVATGDAELIEGNTWKDRFWGVYNGVGDNRLGKLLMDLRNAEIDLRGCFKSYDK